MKLKWLTVGCITLILAGCGMAYEEYTARVEYCIERDMRHKAYRTSGGTVFDVRCVNDEGHKFRSSKGGKQ